VGKVRWGKGKVRWWKVRWAGKVRWGKGRWGKRGKVRR